MKSKILTPFYTIRNLVKKLNIFGITCHRYVNVCVWGWGLTRVIQSLSRCRNPALEPLAKDLFPIEGQPYFKRFVWSNL